ncbi:Manganese transporter smf1 [Mucor velutinosus]|uniref:Manganese transporter smf1 n=1 Tax=Mucor velutinosus TaxID=708070 RepID=A0AAN7DLB4_9FUNG|nr:Manganese transporter smf1 [Mucor velutinosus]
MSGQNYIGSKISLISLSDIRYVGILHNINLVESTVALQNVKSYGTEGRKDSPSEEIPPSNNTFDYVVFRGSDIKDLQVFEAPPSFQSEQMQKPVQQPKPVVEPVVNAAPYNYPPSNIAPYYSTPNMFPNSKNSSTDYTATYGTTSNHWQGSGNAAAYNPYLQQPRYQMPVPENYQTVPSAPPAAAISDLNMNENGASPPSKKEYKVEEEKTVASPKKEILLMNLTSTSMQVKVSQEKEEVAPAIEQVDKALLNSLVKQVSDLDIKQPLIVNKQKSPVRQQKQQQQQTQVNGGNNARVPAGSNSNGNRGRRNSARIPTKNHSTRTNGNANSAWEPNNINGNRNVNNGQRNSSGNTHRRNSSIVIPKSDFDFESSNAKFDKSDMNVIDDVRQVNEEETVIIPEADHFYDKKKSFFDDISCESKEYQKGTRGGKYKEESMLNLETFGQANPAGQSGKRNRHRGGRGGRGRQHRSGRGKAPSSTENSNAQDEV